MKITVTKTYLPNREKYKKYVDMIYENGWVTNNGPLVQLLEKRLAEYLGVKNVVLVANGTLALIIAYSLLELKGSVITTPFSFVATVSSLVISGLQPVFADIDSRTLNINPSNIEKLIDSNISAILPVHVFGNPCKVEEIEHIADRYNLKVIYDAAHAFGVKYKEKSVLAYGDISILSFHATKVFHTIEGGALIINNDELVEKARCLINFGIKSEGKIPYIGINAKMNEFEAAMGLCLLDEIDEIISKRKNIWEIYHNELRNYVEFQEWDRNSTNNYGYFPILLPNEKALEKVQKALNEKNIFPRRYFYPSLDTLPYIESRQECRVSRDVSSRILCLPMYESLSYEIQMKIIKTIKEVVS